VTSSTYQPGYNVPWDATWTFTTTKTSNLNLLQLFKFMLYSGREKLYTIPALNEQYLNAPEGHPDKEHI
jgi:hypothetical protein